MVEASSAKPTARPSMLQRAATTLATWFGCGLSPKAPGTVGSLGAWPLHWWLSGLSPWLHIAGIVTVTLVGTWAAQRVADALGQRDPGRVVVDEVAGALIALGLCQQFGLWVELLAMALFRLLDITKPGFIGRAERVGPAGVGIMLDDLLAGVIAGGFVSALPWGGWVG